MKVQFLKEVCVEVISSKKHSSNTESSNTMDFIFRLRNLHNRSGGFGFCVGGVPPGRATVPSQTLTCR